MFLKRIEMTGFKSFADKTIVEFDNPVTGVVGPNGCGKSRFLTSIENVSEYNRRLLIQEHKKNPYSYNKKPEEEVSITRNPNDPLWRILKYDTSPSEWHRLFWQAGS